MPVHRFTKKSLIPVHTSFQLVPNHPRTTSATPLRTFMIFVNELTMKFQIDKKIPLTPSHTFDQLPVKIPIKISRMPVIIPNVSSSTFAMYVKTPSKIGARKLQNPSHTALMTSVISSKLKPNAFNLSTIPWVNPSKIPLILFQIAVTFFRKFSFVFQRCVNAATRTAMAATTASIGPRQALKPPPAAAAAAPPPSAATDAPLITVPSLLITFMAVPTFDTTFPIMTSAGPKAATKSPIFTMVSLVPSSRLFSQSTKDCSFATIFLIIGIRVSPIEIAKPSTADFRIVS